MRKLLISFVIAATIYLSWPKEALAGPNIAGNSATIRISTDSPAKISPEQAKKDLRKIKLRMFLAKYNSQLADHAEYIVDIADEYNIPWSLVPAIAGVESTFCRRIPAGSYNCWGWNNGNYYFSDFGQAIKIISEALQQRYFAKGLNTPEKIAPIYAPPSKSWGWKVRYFMDLMEKIDTGIFLEDKFSV